MLALLMGMMSAPVASAFQPLEDPIPAPIPQRRFRVKLEPVVTGLVAPIYLTTATSPFREDEHDKNDRDRHDRDGHRGGKLYVVDQTGRALVLRAGAIEDTPLLDISEVLANLAP